MGSKGRPVDDWPCSQVAEVHHIPLAPCPNLPAPRDPCTAPRPDPLGSSLKLPGHYRQLRGPTLHARLFLCIHQMCVTHSHLPHAMQSRALAHTVHAGAASLGLPLPCPPFPGLPCLPPH
ncbi:Hypothetical predicted protein [Marmota monax]|uniref:Uncharacterized protein n=1 Tax=Marmota monax TaxID=9995 RepID=A0A5E4DBY4_MARMO|nr:Hypothetical predicted protein [Marmota monax]